MPSQKIKVISVPDKSPSLNYGEYIGMNDAAAKKLKIKYPYGKKKVIVAKSLSKKKKQETGKHEIEEKAMIDGGLEYKPAHKIATRLEKL